MMGKPKIPTPPPTPNTARPATLAAAQPKNPMAQALGQFAMNPSLIGFQPRKAGRPSLVSQARNNAGR